MPTKVGPWCRHFVNNNFEDHICDAEFALIGEAPGTRENERGIPFTGPSGYDLESWWREAGLRREQFYIDNCYPEQPPGNKLFLINQASLRASTEAMRERLVRTLPRVCVVVPTGNTALRGLLDNPRLNITDWRGSILNWNGHKCIPTIHPAATQRQKILTKLCVADWRRIARESKDPRIILPNRHHIVDPSYQELTSYAEKAHHYFADQDLTELPPRVLSVDVENDIKSKKLLCVGFSFDWRESITVSTLERDFDDLAHYRAGQHFISELLGANYPVVGQNYCTDLWKLSFHFPHISRQRLIDNYVWDLMEMAHCLDPNDGGDTTEGSENQSDEGLRVGMYDLATLTSLYTKEPFYKHMSSHPSQEKRWAYCGTDCCVTREIFDVLWYKLYERGLV
jgi:uracil-DNA glycosylase family 4